VSKSWAEIKALVVGTNTGCVGHVQGWCIGALVNVNEVEQPRDLKGDSSKGCNIWYQSKLLVPKCKL
jgi:hypothetical protein